MWWRRNLTGVASKEEEAGSLKLLLLQDCVEDMVNPIILRLNFSLVGEPIASSQNLRPVLAVGSQDLFTASVSLPRKSQGRADSCCVSVC